VIPTFEERVQQWSHPPIDDVGYLSSADLLQAPAARLRLLVSQAERARYTGWRNYENRWRHTLGLSKSQTSGKTVLDYGCGLGLEALQYCRLGNDVVVADISRENVRLALRVLALEGFDNVGAFQITEDILVNALFGEFDVIHCAGVLHHIPEPEPVVREMAAHLVPDGELRLMLYSAEAWRMTCKSEPPERVEDDPNFEKFWTRWDAVGGYADWYDAERLVCRFGEWFEVVKVQPLTQFGEYLGAVLRKR
jgi:SAM-dependent methyltransferase